MHTAREPRIPDHGQAREDAINVPVPLVHTVTPIAAVRALIPHLPAYTVENIYAQLWHVNAAIITGLRAVFREFSPDPRSNDAHELATDPPTPEDIADQAARHGDAHAIKFAEATLREHAIRPSRVYLDAAQALLHRLPAA